jgi:ribosomal protein S18 acetylase RimI-like enzyme
MIAVRIATPDDAASVARLLEAFNGPPVTPAQAAARMAACVGLETTLLADVDGQTAGLACLRVIPYMSDDRPYAELTELYVEASYRRQGVGRALLRSAEALAAQRGAAELILLTGPENAAGQAFYRALGYSDYGLALRRALDR